MATSCKHQVHAEPMLRRAHHQVPQAPRPESRIPRNHPLRLIRRVADEALKALDGQLASLYSENGRPSIPPEQLLRAFLLQAFYSIRSERQLMEQLNYNLLFRWFVGLSVDDPVWVPTVFSKNRDRLPEGDIAAAFMDAVLNLPRVKGLLSGEHFSVDGTLIQAWATLVQGSGKRSLVERPAYRQGVSCVVLARAQMAAAVEFKPAGVGASPSSVPAA